MAPGVPVDGDAVLGGAAVVLVDASRDAAMTVVGSRGRGGFEALLLGAVSTQVVAHAASPVAVVRSERAFDAGPVVVGVDGSPGGNVALGMAFEEATSHGRNLVERRLVRATPAHALVEVSRDALMLVVGTRGHGGFAGVLLGSVSQYVTHHASCPVLVARPAT